MIELKNIRKEFSAGFIPRKVEVLKGLTFKVDKGEVLGYLGPNGAGKTTTIKILMDLIDATGGSASINGVDVRLTKARSAVGYLPEQPYFYHYLTGFEFLVYIGSLFKMPKDKRTDRKSVV